MPTALSPSVAVPPSSGASIDAAPGGNRRNYYPAIAAALLSLVLYAVTLNGTYIYDDQAVIFEDARVARPSLWPKYLTTQYLPGAADNLYRPLTSMSYALQWWLHGDRPWAFHAVNWLLAAACAAAVAELARRLCGGAAAWIAGLLFAAHPIHVEVVAGIVGRAELACLLATFAGFCLFLRRPLTGRRAAGILACFVLALLSKEQGILFPLLLAALIPFRRKQAAAALPAPPVKPLPPPSPLKDQEPAVYSLGYATPRKRSPEQTAAIVLLIGVMYIEAGYLIFRESILKFAWDRNFLAWPDNPLIRSAGWDRWLMPFVLLGRYVELLVAPLKLSIDYGGNVIGSSVRYHEPYLYIGLGVSVGWLVCFGLALRRRALGVAFALFGLAVTYGLVSNLPALIGTIFGERLMFMPSAFLAVLAGMAAASVLRRNDPAPQPRWRLPAVVVATAVLVVLGSIRTIAYARLWNDRFGFYLASMEAQPRSVRVHALLFREYALAKNWPAAKAVAERCREQVPQWWESWAMCANAEMEMGRLREAKALIDRAFQVCPHDALIGWSEMLDGKIAASRGVVK